MLKLLGCVAASLLLHALSIAVPARRVETRVSRLAPLRVESLTWVEPAPEPARAQSAPAGPSEVESAREPSRSAVPVVRERRERRLEPSPRAVPPSANDVAQTPPPEVAAPSAVEATQAASALTAPPAAPLESAAPGLVPGAALLEQGLSAQRGTAGSSAPTASSASVAGAGGTSDLAAVRTQYLQRLRQRVLERRQYPYAAQRARLEGTVCLRLTLNASGRLAELRPSCGPLPPALLEAALQAVRAAEPFGPLPSALGQQLSVDLPVVFQLDAY